LSNVFFVRFLFFFFSFFSLTVQAIERTKKNVEAYRRSAAIKEERAEMAADKASKVCPYVTFDPVPAHRHRHLFTGIAQK